MEFGNWNSVWCQFRGWCVSGLWDVLLQGLADRGGNADLLQLMDSTHYDALMDQRLSDPGLMLADKGYDSDAIRQDLRDRGAAITASLATAPPATYRGRKGMLYQ